MNRLLPLRVKRPLQNWELESEQNVNLELVPDKNLHEIERLTTELLQVMRKAKVREGSLYELLRALETEAGNARRERFDAVNPEYRGY